MSGLNPALVSAYQPQQLTFIVFEALNSYSKVSKRQSRRNWNSEHKAALAAFLNQNFGIKEICHKAASLFGRNERQIQSFFGKRVEKLKQAFVNTEISANAVAPAQLQAVFEELSLPQTQMQEIKQLLARYEKALVCTLFSQNEVLAELSHIEMWFLSSFIRGSICSREPAPLAVYAISVVKDIERFYAIDKIVEQFDALLYRLTQ